MIKVGKYYITRNNPRKLLKERAELINKIDNAINKLYEWGEVLHPDFQKVMLNILKDNNIKEIK